MELMIKLMKVENEENALVVIKILIDGFRNHKASLMREERDPLLNVRSNPNNMSSRSWSW